MDSQVEDQHQVFVVGDEFHPGSQGNAEIDLLLGHDTVLCGGMAVRGGTRYMLAPDYCTNTALTLSELEHIEVPVFVVGSSKTRCNAKTPSTKGRVAIFSFGGRLHLTRPLETASAALACALWFCLANKSALID